MSLTRDIVILVLLLDIAEHNGKRHNTSTILNVARQNVTVRNVNRRKKERRKNVYLSVPKRKRHLTSCDETVCSATFTFSGATLCDVYVVSYYCTVCSNTVIFCMQAVKLIDFFLL